MPKGDNLRNNPELHRRGGQARAAQMTPDQLSAWGARGAAVTAARYGADFLQRKLAGYYAAHPTKPERALARALRALGLRAGRDFYPQYPAECTDAAGGPHTYVLDVACFTPASQLALEADGAYWHGSPSRALLDAHRDAALTAAGWTVVRLSDTLLADPAATRAALVRALRAAGGLGHLTMEAA